MSDYFLIEDIYGYYTLCKSKRKKIEIKKDSIVPNNIFSSSIIPNTNISIENTNQSQTISFEYNHTTYIFNEKNNSFSPIYLALSKMTNRNIHNVYSEGLISEEMVIKKKNKFGRNEFLISANNIYSFLLIVELPTFTLVLISAIIWICYDNYIFGTFEILLSIIIITAKILYKKKSIYNNNKKKEELLHENNRHLIRVKRKYLHTNDNSHKNTNDNNFVYVDSKDIYPGDILVMRNGDIMECDGLLLEGECMVNDCEIEGTTSFIRKVPLDGGYNLFSYNENKQSILYEGMRIIKCHSKLEDKSIIVLCINTGSNTSCANLYSSILYESKFDPNILYQNRLSHFILNLAIFIISICILVVIKHYKHGNDAEYPIKEFIFKSLATALTPTYHLTLSIVILFGSINLKRQGIQCVDDSRLCLAGKVTTVILDKTGTMSDEKLEIVGYHPIYKVHNELIVKTFTLTFLKSLSREHGKFYTNKLLYNNVQEKNINNIMFLECLVTCHNLEKIHNEICGNILEMEVIKKLKWDINSIDIKIPNTNKEISTIEVYPKNYYKITEKFSFVSNQQQNVKSFKLQIINRFFNQSSFHVSTIVYNTFDNTLRFNIKGSPEEVLIYCNTKTIPNNIKTLLGMYRKEGYRLVVFATKVIDLISYNENNGESAYLSNLTFVGFVTVKNHLKKETKEVVSKLKQMKCELLMCTGDGIFTSLAVGYESKVITDKNIYVFDFDEANQIKITHLYKNEEEKEEKIIEPNDQMSISDNITSFNAKNSRSRNIKTQPSFMNTERKAILENTTILINNNQTKSNSNKMHNDSSSIDSENNNTSGSYHQIIAFKYDSKKLSKMKHNALYCISGRVFHEIYNNKEQYQKLLRHLRHIGRIYFSFSSFQKKELIDFYKSSKAKTICMVGDSVNDITAILSSHVGIKIKVSTHINNNLCHFYSSDGLACIETIIKNGRACFENTIQLYTFVIISSSLESLMNIYGYYLEANLPLYDRVLLDMIIFILSSLAFRTKADDSINYNDLFQGNQFVLFVMAKNVIIIIEKIACQIAFILWYDYNPQIDNGKARVVLLEYLYIFITLQIVSTLFIFNLENYFRKHYSLNKLVNFFILIAMCYYLVILGVSTRFLDCQLLRVVDFENSDYELDYYDDRNKVIMCCIIVIESFVTYVIASGIRKFFEWRVAKKAKLPKKKYN